MSRGSLRPFTRGREILSHAIADYKGQVQNVKAARVYIFGDDDIVEDDENDQTEFEMPEIRSRRGQQGIGSGGRLEEEKFYFEKEIVDGETLQSVSLKYACPVSELKRINNLINDRDFFALRHLKIPMRRHGYLSSIVAQEEQNKKRPAETHDSQNGAVPLSESEAEMNAVSSDVDFSDPEMQKLVIRTVSIRENFSQQGQEAQHFLDKMDKDLSNYRQSAETNRNSLDEVISVLTHTSIYPLQKRKRTDGADFSKVLDVKESPPSSFWEE
ncbi:hypothetical protein C0Q70_20256 [Pomacea canaliculata]|uniref:LysM domain-containing protein n=1 Tax=Pomacea canaliculata TaxID=400727 RepID=A0A2T7NF40_POMCA|nr:hypothetical protein C0Q70_20256 [Pomacea canaliculata]